MEKDHVAAASIGSSSDEKLPVDHVEKASIAVPEEIQIDPIISATVTRRFDKRVVPWLFCLWLLAFVDRSNIGNARIDGLAEDLHLGTGSKYNIALTVFYIPYLLVDVPSNWLVKAVGGGRYLPALSVLWGLVSMCTGFVRSYNALLGVRFLLGMMEGGMLGGMVLYLSMFYERHELLRRVGMMYCAAPLSGAVGGLLATGLSQIHTKGYDGWPFIFIIEGILTILFGILVSFFLPNTPSHAKFLTEQERYVAIHRMKNDAQGATSTTEVDQEKFSWHWVSLAMFNWNTWLTSLVFFSVITPIYSFSLFLPTIISGLGFTSVKANLLTVPPNVCATLSVLFLTYMSDKLKVRGNLILLGASTSIIGYIMLISTGRPWVQYGGTFFAAVGVFPCAPIVMGWLANNSAPHYVRATATAAQIMLANFAAFIATFTYIANKAPRYTTGHAINLALLVLCLVATSVTSIYCKWENRKRERGERDHRLTEGNPELLGYRHPNFRYTS